MRVLYITPSLGAGGAERQATILLPALRRRGVDARALALDSGGPFVEPLRAAGVPVEVADMRHRFHLRPLLRSRLVREFVPEVIVSRGVSGIYVGHALARWRGAAHVYNDHRGVGVELSARRHAMIRALARRLTAVILVSHEQREGWLDYGCPRERIEVIPNGVIVDDTPMATRLEARRELELPDEAVIAMIVASLRPVKRVSDFVHGVRRARKRCPQLVGVVVGDGPDRHAVREAAAGDPAIRVLGHRDDVPRLLQAADVLALTSAHEAMPMAILEGMAAGLPVLATNVGAVAKMVVDGESGLLVPPADPEALASALVRLASDRDLRERLGSAARARCREGWDAERMTDAYLDSLRRACATRRRPRGPVGRRLAAKFIQYVDERGWVTWERQSEDAHILTVTNYWPDHDGPTRAPFMRVTVDGLESAGVKTDLLYVRGYKGKHVYLMACVVMALLPLARRGKYRLVHSHGGETAVVARFAWGLPVLGTYWGTDLLCPRYGGLAEQVTLRVRSQILRLHTRLMTATTTKTDEMKRVLPRSVQARTWVIPDGVDTSVFRPIDRAQARAALDWPEDAPTVISAGSGAMKRHWLARQAVEVARLELPGLRWYALTEVRPGDMPLYYNAADLLLHPSSSEGSPNVIKEAMACNLPVLATPVGDIPELLKGVQVSSTCEPRVEALAEAIVRLIREGRRSNGRESIGPFRVEASTEKTLACYRTLGVRLPGDPD